jgi:hypothetical protein
MKKNFTKEEIVENHNCIKESETIASKPKSRRAHSECIDPTENFPENYLN